MSSDELIGLMMSEQDPPDVIDLSGGQPDLVPEWWYWMMRTLQRTGLKDRTYLRAEHNLSFDLPDRYLTTSQVDYISNYRRFTVVGCLKGFDEDSFSFNTSSRPEGFNTQFSAIKELLDLGLDLFVHATFTGCQVSNLTQAIPQLFDRLQKIHPFLPLRVVPLRVRKTPAMSTRDVELLQYTTEVQQAAVALWDRELMRRFDPGMLSLPVNQVPLLNETCG